MRVAVALPTMKGGEALEPTHVGYLSALVQDLQVLVILEALVLSLEQLVVELCLGVVHPVKDSCVAHLHGSVSGPAGF